ncbi:MAG: M28 family peptidase, partial [Oscillospiraceae bacterium]|nr:M28 family peptidase [Oscillospiraceae bacterium]
FSDPERQFYDELIPAVCVSALDGLKIMYLLGAGRNRARLVCDTEISLRESYIIVGIHRGTELPHETVGIIAHRDVVVDPGANDNGSGSGVMMELARLMSKRSYRRTMLFISSTGEEGVTWGSYLYTRAKKDMLKNMKALFNLDMFAVGGKLNLVDRGYWPDTGWMTHSEELNSRIMALADELGYDLGLMEADWGVSESDRFQSLGVPSIWFWKDGDPNYHTVRDVLENVDGNSLKVVGDLVGITAGRILEQ